MDYPMIGLCLLGVAIYAALFREIRRYRREVQIGQDFNTELGNFLDRAELEKAVRADLGNAFALDEWHDNQTDSPDPKRAA